MGVLSQDEYIKQAEKKYAAQKEQAISDNTSDYAKTEETIKSLYQGKIEETEMKYDDLSRQNEVQKYINAREVAENNANLGITDSGLNRTQQTAVQLSASNNEAKIQRARQSGVDALVREMTVDLSENETNRANSEKAIKQYYEGLASSEGTAAYKADVEAETARINIFNQATEKLAQQKKTDYQELLSELDSNVDNPDYCAKLISNYANLYDIDENGSEMSIILNRAKLNFGALYHYEQYGTVFSTPTEVSQNKEDETYKSGIMKYDYKKDGEQEYVVKLVKPTNNWGGFFNLFETVDGNDEVDIYYADGVTPVAKNVKLGDLKDKNAAQTITNWTAGKKESQIGLTKKLILNLSKEDFVEG